jgi:hypothetical protein
MDQAVVGNFRPKKPIQYRRALAVDMGVVDNAKNACDVAQVQSSRLERGNAASRAKFLFYDLERPVVTGGDAANVSAPLSTQVGRFN